MPPLTIDDLEPIVDSTWQPEDREPNWTTKEPMSLVSWRSLVSDPGQSAWLQVELATETGKFAAWVQRLEAWINSAPPAPSLPEDATKRERIY